MGKLINSYINQFEQLFNGEPWLDETFAKKLAGVNDANAFIQAPNNNHSVAEVMCHLIEWRKEYIRRLAENSAESRLTDESVNNWLPVEQLKAKGWDWIYIEFLKTQHELITLLKSKDDSFLNEPLANTKHNYEYYVAGLLHHDAYHLGQIGLIQKWYK